MSHNELRWFLQIIKLSLSLSLLSLSSYPPLSVSITQLVVSKQQH